MQFHRSKIERKNKRLAYLHHYHARLYTSLLYAELDKLNAFKAEIHNTRLAAVHFCGRQNKYQQETLRQSARHAQHTRVRGSPS